MRRILFPLVVALASGAAQARESAPAVDYLPLGFSADGRWFAYAQFTPGDGADAPAYAIDVLDRATGVSAPGFPFGIAPVSRNGSNRLGEHAIDADALMGESDGLERLKAAVDGAARAKLESFRIARAGARLAALPFTQVFPDAQMVAFRLAGVLPSGVPDTQKIYELRAAMTALPAACKESALPSRTHAVDVTLSEKYGWRRGAALTLRKKIAFATADHACPTKVRILDVLRAPRAAGATDGKEGLAVVMMVTSWGGHSDLSQIVAALIDVE